MKKRIGIILVSLVLVVFVVLSATACKPQNSDKSKKMMFLDREQIKNLSFNLEGVKALGIERREVKTINASGKMVAYADTSETKNKLVGLKEDNSVIEIELREKLGASYKQDELDFEFNKLYVSGKFVYFELIPKTGLIEEVADNNPDSQTYYYYSKDQYDENGELKENAVKKEVRLELRKTRGLVEDRVIEDFDKKSTAPNEVTGAFVYSLENNKIYDLSDEGYEVLADGIARVGDNICRASINEEGEYVATAVFNEYTKGKVSDLWTDKYGNIIGKGSVEFIDEEAKVYIATNDTSRDKVVSYIENEGQAVQLILKYTREGYQTTIERQVKWLDADGLREVREGDNFEDNLRYERKIDAFWNGIKDGEILIYEISSKHYYDSYTNPRNSFSQITRGIANTPGSGPSSLDSIALNKNIYIAMLTQTNGAVAKEDGTFDKDPNAIYAVWYDASKELGEIGVIDGVAKGFNVITDRFQERYASEVVYNSEIDATKFTVQTQHGETTYEFYWDEEASAVKIRETSKYVAPPVEVRKFQPIG